jgi:hypothetical protein
MSDRKRTTTRRDALAALGASASALATAGVVLARAGRGARKASATLPTPPDGRASAGHIDPLEHAKLEEAASLAEVAELLGDVRVGTMLGRCRVVEVRPLLLGALPIVMETPTGERFQLDVLRAQSSSDGVGRAPGLAVFVTNGGNGRTRTDETQGLAAMALGAVIARRLHEGARVPELLSFEERAGRFPRGIFAV